jgi:hypothetical protein
MAMRTQFAAIAFALLGIAGCRQEVSTETDRVGVGKPVESTVESPQSVTGTEHDDDFIQTRSSFEKSTRERLDRLDARIDQLESRADSAGHNAAVQLRNMRDNIAKRLSEARKQSESGWDRFSSEVSKSVDDLEQDVDRLLGY